METKSLLGLFAKPLNWIIKPKEKNWVFGADYGKTYREGTKYLFEYMTKEHPEYHCTFITRNYKVKEELTKKGYRCEMNMSFKGIIEIAKAEKLFMSQYLNDIRFYYKKKGQKIYYIGHGQSFKKAMKALPKKFQQKNNIYIKIRDVIYDVFGGISHVTMKDTEFVAASSDFLAQYMKIDFGNEVPVKVLGMPRNDALFDIERMEKETWLKTTCSKYKLVITYMPTHRAYGAGLASPIPFLNRKDIQDWLENNGILLLVKNHPNMINKIVENSTTNSIIDITKKDIDPQACIYYSDILITDYSSVWIDYLLLKRPIIFYLYDNWEKDDAGLHYSIKEDSPGVFCYSEDELFYNIKYIKDNYDRMKPTNNQIKKYHKYIDGNYCKMYYETIIAEDKKNNMLAI